MVTEKMIEAARDKFKELAGIQIYLPGEGTLDDFEQGRYDALVAALEAALSTDAEPVAFTSQGQLDEARKGSTALLYGKRDEFMDVALYAAPPQPAPSVGVKADRPDSVQAAFDVFAKKPDTGPHATAMFAYIEKLEAALSAQVQDVAAPALKLGIYRKAYDRPEERRAYTYNDQPDNIGAHKLGRACSEIHSGGDWIDRGLNLLNALQREGFGVFELPAAPAANQGEAE